MTNETLITKLDGAKRTMDCYAADAPLRFKIATQRKIDALRAEVRRRGLEEE